MATFGSAQESAGLTTPADGRRTNGSAADEFDTQNHGRADRRRLSPRWHRLLLTAHLIVSVGLLGADASLIALGVAGLSGTDPAQIYPAAHLVARVVLVPLALLALVTGLALGLLTPWGLVRHRWVTIKLALTLVLSGLALFVLTPRLGALADEGTGTAGADLSVADRLPVALAVMAAAAVLVLNVVLARYKPFGRPTRQPSARSGDRWSCEHRPRRTTHEERRRTMQRTIAAIYTGLAWVILAGLLLQFYFAGTALFGATSFETHRSLGMALALPVVALPVLALAGRMGRRLSGSSALLLILTVVQMLLPQLRDSVSWVAALHPVNALALGGVTIVCAREGKAWNTAQGRVREAVEVLSR